MGHFNRRSFLEMMIAGVSSVFLPEKKDIYVPKLSILTGFPDIPRLPRVVLVHPKSKQAKMGAPHGQFVVCYNSDSWVSLGKTMLFAPMKMEPTAELYGQDHSIVHLDKLSDDYRKIVNIPYDSRFVAGRTLCAAGVNLFGMVSVGGRKDLCYYPLLNKASKDLKFQLCYTGLVNMEADYVSIGAIHVQGEFEWFKPTLLQYPSREIYYESDWYPEGDDIWS